VIISGGENISSIEVEDTLYRHPAVMAPPWSPSPTRNGARCPAAFIELREGATVTAEELIEFCREHHGALQGAEAVHLRACCPRPRPARSRSSCCARRPSRPRPSSSQGDPEETRMNAPDETTLPILLREDQRRRDHADAEPARPVQFPVRGNARPNCRRRWRPSPAIRRCASWSSPAPARPSAPATTSSRCGPTTRKATTCRSCSSSAAG
jgi:hypothetical protein